MDSLSNKGLFTFDHWNDEEVIEGYSNQEVHWNGWACPYFTLENALKALEYSETIRFFEHKELENGGHIICFLDDDCEMQIYEGTMFETLDGPKELFGIGVGQWCWVGANCDPEKGTVVSEDEGQDLLIRAYVDNSDKSGEFAVMVEKQGIDNDWWAVFSHPNIKMCKSLADEINNAIRRFGLTK